jgi:hypothetical protein
MKSEFIFYDKVFTAKELNTKHWKGHYTNGSEGDREVLCIDVYPDPEKLLEAYLRSLHTSYVRVLSDYFDDGYTIDAKLSRYREGDSYGWHTDDQITHPSGPKKWKRIISSITYLNDQFEGGETEFLGYRIKPIRGKSLVFPSNWNFPHCGHPVTKGIKEILVMHYWV